MANLPFEIIVSILCRLPVKSLKRFRSVEKRWCLLIDGESFIKLHLDHSNITNSNRNLILGGLALHSIDLDSLEKAHNISPPFYYRSVNSITNSVNGLVVVESDPPVLWNPFSRNYRVLPGISAECPVSEESYSKTAHGFAYDSVSDDYKLVRVVEFLNKHTHVWIRSETTIYSTRSNSWKRLQDFPYPLPFYRGRWRVHINGALHTLVEGIDQQRSFEFVKIMAFSVETEKHYEVNLPQGNLVKDFDLSLDVIEGCLSVVCAKRSRVIIWVMKEYGVKESWTKLLSIRPPLIEPGDAVKPLVYLRDGDKVLLNCADKNLGIYDLREKTLENVFVDGLPFMFYTEVCVESLLWFDGPGEKEIKKRVAGKKKTKNWDNFLCEGFKLVL